MREIKFRGKRVDNGELISGCLINNLWIKDKTKGPVCYIIPDQFPNDGVEYYYDSWEDIAGWIEDFEVIPETVEPIMQPLEKDFTDNSIANIDNQ